MGSKYIWKKHKIMNQRILIFCAAFFAISLTSFGFIKWKDASPVAKADSGSSGLIFDHRFLSTGTDFEFAYSVDPRFLNTVTREELEKAQSITDIISTRDDAYIESYYNIQLSTFFEDRANEVNVQGENEVLTDAQIQLLRSMDYTSSFYITGNVKKRDAATGQLVVDTLVNYMTVLPKQPAAYESGKGALIAYLKEQSSDVIAMAREGQLKPGKISFTVTKAGEIGPVQLTSTSGYTAIDEKMLALIREIPGSWKVATNSKGEKVDQELVFSFGLMGC